jgi:hypothetical protein
MRREALLLGLALAISAASAAHARLIDPKDVQQFCHTNHGTYWPQGGTSHTYGCLTDNMLIVCGGITPKQQESCFIGRHAPPHYRLPEVPPKSGGAKP